MHPPYKFGQAVRFPNAWAKGEKALSLARAFHHGQRMLEKLVIQIGSIRVPAKRGKTLDGERLQTIAEDMVENGQTTPIQVRKDGAGYILVEGLHRLEALRALGETEVEAYIVRSRLH